MNKYAKFYFAKFLEGCDKTAEPLRINLDFTTPRNEAERWQQYAKATSRPGVPSNASPSFIGQLASRNRAALNTMEKNESENGGRLMNEMGKSVFNFFAQPFRQGAQDWRDSNKFLDMGDYDASIARRRSSIGNFALGAAGITPIVGLGSKALLGARAATPAIADAAPLINRAPSMLREAWNMAKNTAANTLGIGGPLFIQRKGDIDAKKTPVGYFDAMSKEMNPELQRTFTRPGASLDQSLNSGIGIFDQALDSNPVLQSAAQKIKSMPQKQRIETSIPYEMANHDLLRWSQQ